MHHKNETGGGKMRFWIKNDEKLPAEVGNSRQKVKSRSVDTASEAPWEAPKRLTFLGTAGL